VGRLESLGVDPLAAVSMLAAPPAGWRAAAYHDRVGSLGEAAHVLAIAQSLLVGRHRVT